jgi:D-inositol-3-phosphate glycosyltransferase
MNVFLKGLLSALGRQGVRTDVLTRGTGDAPVDTEPAEGARIRHVPCGWTAPPTRGTALACLPRFAAKARAFVAESGPYDVVSAHYWMSGAALLAMDAAPQVFMYHTVEARKGRRPGPPDPLRDVRTAQEKKLAAAADRLVYLSEDDRKETERLFPEAAGKGETIPPGVDGSFFLLPPREEARRRLGVAPEVFLFLLAARPDPGKNVASALEAFRGMRARQGDRFRLLLAGQGPPEGGLPEGARALGAVPHAEMPALYAAADAVLCPSSYESFGFVPLEAMAAGVPVILPGTGYWGARGRGEGTAAVYPPGDPDGLARTMRAVAERPALRARLSEAGRAAAREFTWEKCAASWARLLSRLATRGSPR